MRLRHRPRPFAVPVGVHHRIPADQTSTRPRSTVKVIVPEDPPVPVLSAATLAPLPAREPGANWPPPGADPAPVVTEVVFRPEIARALWADYHQLPVFHAAAIAHRRADRERRLLFAGLQNRKPPATGELP